MPSRNKYHANGKLRTGRKHREPKPSARQITEAWKDRLTKKESRDSVLPLIPAVLNRKRSPPKLKEKEKI